MPDREHSHRAYVVRFHYDTTLNATLFITYNRYQLFSLYLDESHILDETEPLLVHLHKHTKRLYIDSIVHWFDKVACNDDQFELSSDMRLLHFRFPVPLHVGCAITMRYTLKALDVPEQVVHLVKRIDELENDLKRLKTKNSEYELKTVNSSSDLVSKARIASDNEQEEDEENHSEEEDREYVVRRTEVVVVSDTTRSKKSSRVQRLRQQVQASEQKNKELTTTLTELRDQCTSNVRVMKALRTEVTQLQDELACTRHQLQRAESRNSHPNLQVVDVV